MSKLGRQRRTRSKRILDRLTRAHTVEQLRLHHERKRASFFSRLTKEGPAVR